MIRFLQRIPVSVYLFTCFWLIVGVIYLPAYQAGFYLDFYGLLESYYNKGFLDFVNRAGSDYKSLYQVTQFELYCLVRLFGIHPIPWFLLFTGLHALNGCLIYRFFTRFLLRLNYASAKPAVLVGVLIFLISPVEAAVVIWKACFHYLTAVMMIFMILNWTLSFLETRRTKYLWLIACVYFISIFTLELFYLTPAFVFIVLAFLWQSGNLQKQSFIEFLKKIFIPLVLIWIGYILLYYFTYHKWQAHYEFDPARVFTFSQVISKLAKYIIHILGMEYLLPQGIRSSIYRITELPAFVVIAGCSMSAFILWMLITFRKRSVRLKIIFVLFLLALLSFILILPLWFNDMQLLRNDNYYYQPSVFLFIMLGVIFFGIKLKALRYALTGIYLSVCIYGTITIVMSARQSAKMYFGLLHGFKWKDAKTVVLLNLPNNYNGIGMIPADDPDFLNPLMKVFVKDSIKGKVYDVSSYNVQHPWDGAHVTVIDSLQLKVTLNQWGSWWWYRSVGAVGYENELYQLDMKDMGHEYILRFKQRPDSAVILFQQGEHWREVDMSRFGEEQW